MSISTTIGGLPVLSLIWDHGPVVAAAIVFAINFGVICFLMLLEGVPPWRRDMYRAFLYGDSIFIPLYCGMVAIVLKDAPVLHGFYTEPWWHRTLIFTFAAVSVAMEISAVTHGQYTIWEELSPSKLWHTFIFAVVGYWIASTIIPVFVVMSPSWAMIGIAIAIVGFVCANVLDWRHGLNRKMHVDVRTIWKDRD